MEAAAFFRVEGTLVKPGAVSAATYFAANGAGFRERALRLSHMAVAGSVYSVLGQSDRVLANRLAYLGVRNMSEDRVAVLAEEYVHDMLVPRLLEGGLDLLRKARREGYRVVLISDALVQILEGLRAALPAVDACLGNHLEFRACKATGRLLDPVIGGHDSSAWAEQYAQTHSLSLSQSVVYAAHGPDLLLMSRVGRPCAVNPDFTLRRAARQAGWPVLDYHA